MFKVFRNVVKLCLFGQALSCCGKPRNYWEALALVFVADDADELLSTAVHCLTEDVDRRLHP